ncbi:hypothetical protein U1769_00920 [Sphingomonas sp. ZT3P38]|uniref:hypothetical protein n=1 Tax=Parasphingomonas zepuensis TaxID=3096161 RepID=UPI002FC65E40
MTIDPVARHYRLVLPAILLVALPGIAPAQMPRPEARAAPELRDGAHDFDFEFGRWKAHVARRLKPLTGSTTWVEYDGLSVVRPVWGGQANLGELAVAGPAGRIQGMSLRLYDASARQWKIRWANSADSELGAPMVGSFANGRGLFYNQEALNGRAILVRFIFSNMAATSFRIEQAFSDDGGRNWEVNWISDFTRLPDQ